jgi:hypothetical protein
MEKRSSLFWGLFAPALVAMKKSSFMSLTPDVALSALLTESWHCR